jgi:hypothetical protein
MENYIGLVISIEDYHDSTKLKKVKYALNDATIFIDSFVKLGCQRDKFKHLNDNLATKTTIIESLRELTQYARPNETIIFYYAGPGFFYNGRNRISCVDTSLASIESTTVEINSIIATMDKSKSNKVIVFLDCCHSGIEFTEVERSPVTDFSTDDLKYKYREAEHLMVFASCKSDEKSHTDLERKHGVWSYYLIQALTGKAKDIYDNSLLFSDKLQKYLLESTNIRVKKITTEKQHQTPVKYGKETADKFIVADLTKIFAEAEISHHVEGIRFERATILYSEDDWVRNLPGFKPSHKPPKEISDYYEDWIQKIATELIEEELNEISDALKQKLKYKRKDIEDPIIENGFGQISTLDFDYIVSVTQSKERPDKYILTRSIENFKNSNILNNPDFNAIFENSFNELEFRSIKNINVVNIIDKIEEIDNEDLIKVNYERTDITMCKVYLNNFEGYISISQRSFKIVMDNKNSPQNLVLSCQRAYQSIGQNGISNILE